MTQKSAFDTATMAKVYAQQGYLRKAAAIYRRLIATNPDRYDLRQALEALEKDMAGRQGPTRKEVALLLREWRDLISQYKSMKQGNR
jgi:tetratricopeptide (TPR) repeat protein